MLNNVGIEITSMSGHSSKCGGLFCDRQRTIEIDRGSRACGFYSMNSRISNIVMVHGIDVISNNKVLFEMENFSSLSFSKIYMEKPFSPTFKFNMLDYSDLFYKLQDCADTCVEYINSNGGFTVIGWYKRGEINDISNEESENLVDSEKIWYHVVCLYPTRRTLLDSDDLNEKVPIF